MLTFLSVAFSIYGAMHVYMLGKVWFVFPHSLWLGFGLVFGGFVMTLSPLILWYISKQNWHSALSVISWLVYLWMGFLFLFCCTALVFDIGRATMPATAFKWPLNNTMHLLSTCMLSLIFSGYGFIEARQLKIKEVHITTPKLVTGRITIAQISDLHLGAMLNDEFLQRVIAKLKDIQPDIVVATGDIIDGQGDDLNVLAERFHTLHPPLGLFAVTGNHEYFAGLEDSLRFLNKAGFTVLRGKAVSAGGIILLGVDDPTAHAMGQETMLDTKDALVSISGDQYIVLLKHQPLVDRESPFDLQLSGHIHGGQIFPFGLLTWISYGVRTGLTQLANGRMLYVSPGTGTWGPPIRLFAAPEITLITISRGNSRKAYDR